jgi:hypothetical protein
MVIGIDKQKGKRLVVAHGTIKLAQTDHIHWKQIK